MINKFVASAVVAASMLALLPAAAVAAGEGDYAPANILKPTAGLAGSA